MDPVYLRGYSKHKALFVSVAGSRKDRNLLGKFGERDSLVRAVLMYTQVQGRRGYCMAMKETVLSLQTH